VKLASVVLSLNASFMFAGFALGAALGSATITHSSPAALGFVGTASILAGLILAFAITRAEKSAAGAVLQMNGGLS
jgi:predicted MFS family arabinose efflux permease